MQQSRTLLGTPIQRKNCKKYYSKVIHYGDGFQLIDYQHGVNFDFKRSLQSASERIAPKSVRRTSEEEQRARDVSDLRRRQKIYQYINQNKQHFKNFLTLTYSYPQVDLKHANQDFKQFIKKVKKYVNKKGKVLYYFGVWELQSDIDYEGNVKPFGGNIHFHLLLSGGIRYNKVFSKWGHGAVNIRSCSNVANIAAYVSKYLSKKDLRRYRYKHMPAYFKSKNLQLPREILIFNRSQTEYCDELLTTYVDLHNNYISRTPLKYIGDISYRNFLIFDYD